MKGSATPVLTKPTKVGSATPVLTKATKAGSSSADPARLFPADQPMTLGDVLEAVDGELAVVSAGSFRSVATGFVPLDDVLAGGLHAGDLILIAGAPGTGKTTLSLQMARNVALAGRAVCLYVCFDHDELHLLNRLIALESSPPEVLPDGGLTIREVERIVGTIANGEVRSLARLAAADSRFGRAVERARAYEDRFCLQRGSGRAHTVPALDRLADAFAQRSGKPVVVFVDYLQKVPSEREYASEYDRITRVAEGLKELALRRQTCVVSNAALDGEGLRAHRLAVRYLSGSTALAYEADAVLMLAEKTDCVARVYFEFSPQKVEGFREWIVASLVKNRSGQNGIDLEFRKRFASASFDPIGGFVEEKLVDGRLYA